MFIKKKVYMELVYENSKLENKIKELKDKIAVIEEKKKKADALCKGCVHLIEGKKQSGLWAADVYECALNRTCKDFDEKDKTDMEQVIEFVEKLGKGN